MTEQKLENVIASVRVSNALLAEPLRIYCRTMANVPALGDRELEEVAGPGPVVVRDASVQEYRLSRGFGRHRPDCVGD